MVRLALFNPMSLQSPFRTQEVSEELKEIDLISLVGTQRRADRGEPHTAATTSNHDIITRGYGRGKEAKLTTKSCGISIMIHKKIGGKQSIASVHSPPPELQGRGGAIRLRWGKNKDILVVAVYAPTKPQQTHQRQNYNNTLSKLFAWVKEYFENNRREQHRL